MTSSRLFSIADPRTCNSSSNDVDTDRTRTATEEASYDQCREVWRRCGRDEPDLSRAGKTCQSGVWKRATLLRVVLDLQGTRCMLQSTQAYDLCSPSRARRAVGRLPRLHSTRQSPSTATGSWPARCRILLPSARCQSRRHRLVNQSGWSYGAVSDANGSSGVHRKI